MSTQRDKKTGANNVTVGEFKKRRWFQKNQKLFLIIAVVLVAVSLAIAGFLLWNNNQSQPLSEAETTAKVSEELTTMNQYLQDGDNVKALEHARKALAYDPADIDIILTTAHAAEEAGESEEARQLYKQALEIAKEEDNPDAEGKTASVYWSTGTIAESAGLTQQAVRYYNKALEVANSSNPDDQNIIRKSREALERLQ